MAGATYIVKVVEGFTWDEGPHVSFTPYEYVKNYFADNCEQQYLEYQTNPTNFYRNNWIPHPAQSNMYSVPQPLRTTCINDVISIRKEHSDGYQPKNYQDWMDYAFGKNICTTLFRSVYPEILDYQSGKPYNRLDLAKEYTFRKSPIWLIVPTALLKSKHII